MNGRRAKGGVPTTVDAIMTENSNQELRQQVTR